MMTLKQKILILISDQKSCLNFYQLEETKQLYHQMKKVSNPKNIVVTGGNNGVGYETVKALYEQGHNVIFGSRNQTKNKEAVASIMTKEGGSIVSFPLDLSVRKSVEDFAKNVMVKFDHVDILVNNAGLNVGQRQVNQQGIQKTLAVNHFGHFYLTYLLWDHICKSSQARILNVSSQLHYAAPTNYLTDIECNNKSYSSFQQYNISKLFNVLFTRGLNDLILKNQLKHIKTASLHPGVVDTSIYQGSRFFRCMWRMSHCCMISQQQGARTSLYLSRVPFAEIRSGQYYHSDTTWKEMDRRGRNVQDVKILWKISQKIYEINFQ